MEKLIQILQNLHADVDWERETQLIDGGLLDSFDMITLVGALNDSFGVDIELEHLLPENFNSVQAMLGLLKSLGAAL